MRIPAMDVVFKNRPKNFVSPYGRIESVHKLRNFFFGAKVFDHDVLSMASARQIKTLKIYL